EDGLVDAVAVHAGSAEGGEEGWVDVDDAAFVAGGDLDEFEVAGEDDPVDAVFAEEGAEAFGGDDAGDDEGGDAGVAGVLGARAFAAGDDEFDGGGEGAGADVVEEVEEGAAARGEEDGEARGGGHAAAFWRASS